MTFSGSVLGGTWVDDSAPAPQSAQNLQAISFDTGTFAMQPLWSGNDNGCVQ